MTPTRIDLSRYCKINEQELIGLILSYVEVILRAGPRKGQSLANEILEDLKQL